MDIPSITQITVLTILFSVWYTGDIFSAVLQPTEGTIIETYKESVVLIVNGDDVGVTRAFTDATLDAYLKGGVSSVSIVATGHDIERTITLFKKHPELPVGVHLTLTGDWKPLTAGKSICAENGLMYTLVEEAGKKVVPAEAEVEWNAQIKKIIDAGLEVSHIDAHMGCYFQSGELFNIALQLSKKYRVPLIAPVIADWVTAPDRDLLVLSSYTGIYRLENQEETLQNRRAAYWKKISGLTSGIHYFFTHQGIAPSDGTITGDLDLRINETGFWVNDETKAELAARGIIISGCMPLKKKVQDIMKNRIRTE